MWFANIFFNSVICLFIFLTGFFTEKTLLILMRSKLPNFLWIIIFMSNLRTVHLSIGPQDFLLCFFIKVLQFYVLHLSPWSILRFFVYGMRFRSNVFCFVFVLLMGIQWCEWFLKRNENSPSIIPDIIVPYLGFHKLSWMRDRGTVWSYCI